MKKRGVFRDYAESFLIAFILAMLIRTYDVQAFKIPTGSMRMTLMEGDRILVNKFVYRMRDPERWEVVVFKYPVDMRELGIERDFIKRVVGKPGETLEIAGGEIYVNGKLAGKPGNVDYYRNMGGWDYGRKGQEFKVPPDSYFVLGDNSPNSSDSRKWGFMPRDYLKGKAFVVYWSVSEAEKRFPAIGRLPGFLKNALGFLGARMIA